MGRSSLDNRHLYNEPCPNILSASLLYNWLESRLRGNTFFAWVYRSKTSVFLSGVCKAMATLRGLLSSGHSAFVGSHPLRWAGEDFFDRVRYISAQWSAQIPRVPKYISCKMIIIYILNELGRWVGWLEFASRYGAVGTVPQKGTQNGYINVNNMHIYSTYPFWQLQVYSVSSTIGLPWCQLPCSWGSSSSTATWLGARGSK